MIHPFVIGTHNAGKFLHAGVDVLRTGGSALDAVEVTTRSDRENIHWYMNTETDEPQRRLGVNVNAG